MPFWKKSFSKARGVYYPRAIVQGNPVETETIAKDLARISTVSNSDVQAVLGDIAPVMHARMAQGRRGVARRLRFPKTSESRPRGVHSGAYPYCQRDLYSRPRGQRPVGMD